MRWFGGQSDNARQDASQQGRVSIFEMEEKLRLERSRHFRLINTTLVGAMVGVSWSYIVEQVVDPYAKCPGRGCWALIVLLGSSLVGGVLVIPLVQLMLQQTLGAFLFRLEALDSRHERLPAGSSPEDSLFGAAAVLAVERHSIFAPVSASTYGFRKAVVGKLLLLLLNAGDSAFVVTCANLLYYVTRQLEYEASGNSSEGGRHYVAVVGICALVCFAAACAAAGVAIYSTRRLTTEVNPYRVRLWLLLSTHPHYPAAYALSIAVSAFVFSPLELGVSGTPALKTVLAVVQLHLLCLGGIWLSRRFLPPPSDPELRLAQSAEDPRVCASFVAHDGCGVVAAIGVQNFVSFALRACDVATLLAVYAVYAPLLLMNAHFRHRRRVSLLRKWQHLDDDDDTPASYCCSVQDAKFEDTVELWLVTLGFRVPYTIVLYYFWNFVAVKTNNPVTTYLFRFLQQIAIAGFLTLFVAVLAGLIVVVGEVYARCFLHKSGGHASSVAALHDGWQSPTLDGALSPGRGKLASFDHDSFRNTEGNAVSTSSTKISPLFARALV